LTGLTGFPLRLPSGDPVVQFFEKIVKAAVEALALKRKQFKVPG
jgi:hypothetical protein